ncbi:unnamed protein product [Choristocarpus tenellus]
MLLETSFFGQAVDKLETQLLALTHEISMEQALGQGPKKSEGERQQKKPIGIFNEDAAIVEKRAYLTMRQQRLSAALSKIDSIAPNVLATSRRQVKGDRAGASRGGEKGSTAGGQDLTPTRISAEERPPEGGDHVRSFKLDPVVYAGSLPEQRSLDAKDGSLAHFQYTRDGDNGGLVYWLGTRRHKKKFENPHELGLLWVTSSGLKEGSEATLVSRKRVPCSTTDKADSWICFDVGKNQSMDLSHYSLCHGSPQGGCDLVNWVCEGYDSSIKMWVILLQDVRESPPSLPSPFGVGTWKVNTMGKAYRFLRLRSTGANSSAGFALPVCAMELYGKLFAHPEL